MKLALSNDIAYAYATGDPAAGGGAERAQWLLSRALARSGCAVVVGVRRSLAPGQEAVVDGVRFVGMERGHFLPAWTSFLTSERPDWWYWRTAAPLWGPLVLVSRAKGVRGIFSAAFDTDVNPQLALTRREHWWPLYALGLRVVDRIFVQHTGQLADLRRKLRAKASIVPGVVTVRDRVCPRGERGAYVAWIAALRKPKRPDLLIELAQMTPDIRYVVCGGADTYRTPEGFSEAMADRLRGVPNIDYMGHVDPAKTLDIVGNATALLSTSDQEGFPNTFLEAWSAGTPVVSLKVDPGGVIRRRAMGFVSGSLDQAVQDLHRVFDSRETFESISRSGRCYVEENHSAEAVSRVFHEAIARSND